MLYATASLNKGYIKCNLSETPVCGQNRVVNPAGGGSTHAHFCLNRLLLENFIIMLVCSKKMANVVLLFCLFLMLLDGKLEMYALCFLFLLI